MSSNATNPGWNKAWAGRFEGATNPLMERFNASIIIDIRLWEADIVGNMAWARALNKIKIISESELKRIEAGLDQIKQAFASDKFPVLPNDEDIHMAVERRLTELIGDPAQKLHTGRSRNDQVVTDFRWYLKQEIQQVRQLIRKLQAQIVLTAETYDTVILPGYTHLQQAQPVLFAHYILSLFFALERDADRLMNCYSRFDELPLGAGALAGSAFPIDREFLARELGFSRISENSIDAVSDRDFVVELVTHLAQIQIHLSRYAEDFIIWSSQEFNFIELDDAWATGSSMMPQKKNPDSLELIRGKAAKLVGAVTQLMTLLKGLPLTYAKDLQEDKETTFAAIDTVKDTLQVFAGILATLKIHPAAMTARMDSMLLATDIADYLVKKGMPFRQSHKVVGKLVRMALERQCPLNEIPLEKYQELSELFSADIFDLLNWQNSLTQRNLPGGTGPQSVERQIIRAKQIISGSQKGLI